MSIFLSKAPGPTVSIERKIVRTSVLSTAMRCEWRLLRFDPGWWTAIALLLACVGYALANGRSRIDERARSISRSTSGRGEAA